MSDVKIVRQAAKDSEHAAMGLRDELREGLEKEAAALTRAADALAREPALMRVVEAAQKFRKATYDTPEEDEAITDLLTALRALDEVGP